MTINYTYTSNYSNYTVTYSSNIPTFGLGGVIILFIIYDDNNNTFPYFSQYAKIPLEIGRWATASYKLQKYQVWVNQYNWESTIQRE